MRADHLVLVDLYWTRDKDPRVPLGHASIHAVAVAAGVVVTPLVYAVNTPGLTAERITADILAATDADSTVAIGAYVWGESLLRVVLTRLRAAGFNGRIVLGGPQISYATGGLEALYPEADAFIRGYGEEALVHLLRSPAGAPLPGVHWAGNPDRCTQAQVDLERLPSPWLTGLIPLHDQRFVRWETQRGCPFRCSFCQHKEAGARLKRRALGLTRIEREIDLFCAAGVDDIAVLDPIFNMGPNAAPILERFAANGYQGRLSLQCRAEMLDDRFLAAAANLNTRLEFGLQTIHAAEGRAIQRGNKLSKVDAMLAEVRSRGIDHEVSLIFGLPRQTLASFEQSVQWCLDRDVPVIKAFPLLLLRGTGLDQERERWGFKVEGGAMPKVVGSNSFSRTDWHTMNRLSAALKATEGHHPAHVEALHAIMADARPDDARWSPAPYIEPDDPRLRAR